MKHSFKIAFATVALLGVAGCATDNATAPTRSGDTPAFASTAAGTDYVIIATGTTLPANLANQIAKAGGTLTGSAPQIGVAFATSSSPTFAANATKIKGLQSVTQDMMVQWVDPNPRVVEEVDDGLALPPPEGSSIGDNETFFNAQWAPKAIHAPEAWDLGARGAGVRVAILDGGINDLHIDLNGSVDAAHSASFVPGFAFNQDVGGFSHATHVGGIVAAQDDAIGTIGVAPSATLIGVKVLHNGSGSFTAVINGIVFAATSIAQGGGGANIINMSLGAVFPLNNKAAAQLVTALGRATNYAWQQGVTIIASAGNNALDLDHTGNVISVPAMSPHVIAVAATGPVGFALGATNFTRPASYTNFGSSAIEHAAPGGDFVLPGSALCTLPRIPTGSITTLCWVFDMVISPGSIPSTNGYFWAAGTSMAAPHVAGVAALIIEKNGGTMAPDLVRDALIASSDDLGKAGNDPFYGQGFVNALRAVQ